LRHAAIAFSYLLYVAACPHPFGKLFVAVKRRSRLRGWSWEIWRRSKPLGVRLHGDGFKTEFAAKLAGEKALRELLDGLAQEENA
jgi:hypothetical protein